MFIAYDVAVNASPSFVSLNNQARIELLKSKRLIATFQLAMRLWWCREVAIHRSVCDELQQKKEFTRKFNSDELIHRPFLFIFFCLFLFFPVSSSFPASGSSSRILGTEEKSNVSSAFADDVTS